MRRAILSPAVRTVDPETIKAYGTLYALLMQISTGHQASTDEVLVGLAALEILALPFRLAH